MPTLEEILESDLGLGSESATTEKVASQATDSDIDNEIEKLAMEVGLVDNFSSSHSESEGKQKGQSKEASMSLANLYSDLFPQDADVMGAEKVASEQPAEEAGLSKEAAAREERIGGLAFDYFQGYVDAHLDKIAEELTGGATISVDQSNDGEPPQEMDNNKDDSEDGIDTTPEYTDMVTAQKGDEVVGKQEQIAPAGNGQLKQAAVRKHMLLAQLQK